MQLQVFKYEHDNVLDELATVEIGGQIWFVAADVCKLLLLTNPTEALKGVDDEDKLTSEILRAGQNRRVNLVNESGLYTLIFRSNKVVAKQFKRWVTKEVLPQIRKTGSYNRPETPMLIPVYQKRIMSRPDKSVPEGYWSVFGKSHSVMLAIETMIGSINKYDIVDGSIGAHWARYRETQAWARGIEYYTHEYTDNRGKVRCKCYHISELQYFEKWLTKVYCPCYLEDYLKNKYIKEKNKAMLDRVQAGLPLLLRWAS